MQIRNKNLTQYITEISTSLNADQTSEPHYMETRTQNLTKCLPDLRTSLNAHKNSETH